MDKTKKAIISVIIVAVLVIVMLGVTYAYFTAGITGAETASTIVGTGGRMTITYQNNSNIITMQNIYPRSSEWVTKSFTVRGTNTTDLQMNYKVYLVVDSNNFAAGDLTCSLTGQSETANQTMVSASGVSIPTSGNVQLGTLGTFATAENVDHVYTLKIFYLNTNSNQNSGQGKVFKAHINITNDEA